MTVEERIVELKALGVEIDGDEWQDDIGEWHDIPKADIREEWKVGLSETDLTEATLALDTVFEGGAIGGPLYGSEVIMVADARRDFKEITGYDANTVIESYAFFGYPEDGTW